MVKYPHLKPEDIFVWERFIDANPKYYDTVEYDVGVSKVEEATAKANALDISGAERLYQYKIDAVGYHGDIIDIIELKGIATAKALGQVELYQRIYDRDENHATKSRKVIIAGSTTPELDFVANTMGILLIVV